jgi:hypothetical protein
MKKNSLYIVLFAISCLGLISCKVRYSLRGISIPAEAKTISVGFFTNNTTLGAPSLSQRFTEKMRDVVSSQTPLALVSQNGDLQFEGYIAEYNVAPTAIQSTDLASLNRLTISVNVKFINKLDPSKNYEQMFTRFADFKSSESISSKEPDLVLEIYRQLSEDIFNKSFNNW